MLGHAAGRQRRLAAAVRARDRRPRPPRPARARRADGERRRAPDRRRRPLPRGRLADDAGRQHAAVTAGPRHARPAAVVRRRSRCSAAVLALALVGYDRLAGAGALVWTALRIPALWDHHPGHRQPRARGPPDRLLLRAGARPAPTAARPAAPGVADRAGDAGRGGRRRRRRGLARCCWPACCSRRSSSSWSAVALLPTDPRLAIAGAVSLSNLGIAVVAINHDGSLVPRLFVAAAPLVLADRGHANAAAAGATRPLAARRLYQLRTFPWASPERPLAMVRRRQPKEARHEDQAHHRSRNRSPGYRRHRCRRRRRHRVVHHRRQGAVHRERRGHPPRRGSRHRDRSRGAHLHRPRRRARDAQGQGDFEHQVRARQLLVAAHREPRRRPRQARRRRLERHEGRARRGGDDTTTHDAGDDHGGGSGGRHGGADDGPNHS